MAVWGGKTDSKLIYQGASKEQTMGGGGERRIRERTNERNTQVKKAKELGGIMTAQHVEF